MAKRGTKPSKKQKESNEKLKKDNSDIRKFLTKKENRKNEENHKVLDDASKIEESKDQMSKFSIKTSLNQRVEKQLLLTNQSLKIHIPLTKIGCFGVLNKKPDNPEIMLKKLETMGHNEKEVQEKEQKTKNKKKKGKKIKKSAQLKNDGLKQENLDKYLKSKMKESESENENEQQNSKEPELND